MNTRTACLLVFGLVSVHTTAGHAQYERRRNHLTLDPTKSGPKRGAGFNDSLRIVPIYWNNTNTSCGGNDKPTVTEAQLQNFYGTVSLSSYYGWIQSQYHTPHQLESVDGVTITSNTCDFSSSNIGKILVGQIGNGVPKDPNGGTSAAVYAIHFGPATSPRLPFDNNGHFLCDGAASSACAYNTTAFKNGQVVSWYAIPDASAGPCQMNCAIGAGPLDAVTVSESHELIEALTDPNNGGWENRTQSCNCSPDGICQSCNGPSSSSGQIADLCAGTSVTIQDSVGNSTVVQPMWSNVSNQCRGATVGAPGRTIGGLFADPDAGSSVTLSGLNSGVIRTAISNGTTDHTGSGTFSFLSSFLTDDAAQCPNCWTAFAQDPSSFRSILAGDFDGDGFGDLAITGPSGWLTIPIARSRGFSSWRATNQGIIASPAPPGLDQGFDFTVAASQFHLPPVAGDFNGDGISDLAMVGGAGWNTIPVAFSTGDAQGRWWSTNKADNGFNGYIARSGNARPALLAADFNADGLTDLALLGLRRPSPRSFIVVVFSKGDGTFSAPVEVPTTYDGGSPVSDFNVWSTLPGVKAVAGDFNGDGLGDIALTGGLGWASIPVAYGTNGDINRSFAMSPGKLTAFTIFNETNSDNALFNSFSSQIGTEQLVAGDFDANGTTDLALTGGQNWSSIPIAFSQVGLGRFFVTNVTTSELRSFSEDAAQSGSVAQSVSRFTVDGF
ncbi:MAG TPA: VCBS repeat-containing protein [Polyangia bacterium]|nr:VCBS repeat-containing protein [Polyangia bacterium]